MSKMPTDRSRKIELILSAPKKNGIPNLYVRTHRLVASYIHPFPKRHPVLLLRKQNRKIQFGYVYWFRKSSNKYAHIFSPYNSNSNFYIRT